MTHSIEIFDELLPMHDRIDIFNFAMKSKYQIGWADSFEQTKSSNKDMYASISNDEQNALGLRQMIMNTDLANIITNYEVSKIAINLTRSCDIHYVHTHPEDKILLYYANLSWEDGWEGETFFYKEDGKGIDIVLPYTPGRFVLFDGRTPHSIRAQSDIGPQYRFTMAIGLIKKEQEK